VTIVKEGRFIMTGYRRGAKVRCGRDATGYKLFAMSGVDCARRGYGWRQILRTYYGPGISLVGDGGGSGAPDAPAAPPETSVAQPSAPPAPPTSVPVDPPGDSTGSVSVGGSTAAGAVGGAQSGGLAESVQEHEQHMMLLWLASNSLV
jgi:hypothetical protein